MQVQLQRRLRPLTHHSSTTTRSIHHRHHRTLLNTAVTRGTVPRHDADARDDGRPPVTSSCGADSRSTTTTNSDAGSDPTPTARQPRVTDDINHGRLVTVNLVMLESGGTAHYRGAHSAVTYRLC